MSTKINRWIPVLIGTILFIAAATLSLPTQAFAAQPASLNDNTCLSCHEDLYYLHDSGKLYCITEQADRCVNCHAGNAVATKEEEAHAGLVLHPQENNGQKCLECHTAKVTQDRLTVFASEGGFKTLIRSDNYIPSAEVITGFPHTPKTNPILENWKWLTGFSALLGLWLILVLFSPLTP